MRAVPFAVLATIALATCLACVAATATGTALATTHDIAGTPGTTPTLQPPYRCVHDEVQRRIRQSGMPMTRIMRRTAAGGTERIANASAEGDWAPLRVAVFTQDLYIAGHYCSTPGENVSTFDGQTRICTADNILTPAKRDTLVRYMLPSAVGLHERYLQVQRISGSVIVVPNFTDETCGSFTIPSAHHTDGVSDADLVLYVASTPAYNNGVAAWAGTCTLSDDDGRPLVGVTNIMTNYIARSRDTARTASHELLHALGFSSDVFNLSHMITQVPSIRGKPDPQYVVNSTNVVREARKHYNCSTLQWMELEDEGTAGTVGSHWERRNAKDEVMAGMVGIGYYTALTIAAMEDLGYYKGNYTNAEIMPWGRNAGCDLLNEKCLTDGITKYPDMFCNDLTTLQCASDRMALGSCFIAKGSSAVPDYYRYFTDPTLYGASSFVDFCPIIESFPDASCNSENMVEGMASGATSRCLDATNTPDQSGFQVRGICANITCDAATSTYQVTFAGSSEPLDCPEGSTIDLSTTGATLNTAIVTCAPYNGVCGIHDVETNEGDSSSDSASPPVSSSSGGGSSSAPPPVSSSSSGGSSASSSASSSSGGSDSASSSASSSSGGSDSDALSSTTDAPADGVAYALRSMWLCIACLLSVALLAW